MTGRYEHTVPYRVRFDECTPRGVLRTSTLLRYAQDVAWVHSENLGFDHRWYAERGLTWLVRGVDLVVGRDGAMGETLAVTTRVVGTRRVWARRRADVAGEDGRAVATILTDWVLIDAAGVPVRLPPEFEGRFAGEVERFLPTRVALPRGPATVAGQPFPVRAWDLDALDHVNNARYLDFVDEALAGARPELVERRPVRYRMEYIRGAGPGLELRSLAWPDGPGLAYRLESGDGEELLRAVVGPPDELDEPGGPDTPNAPDANLRPARTG